MRIRFHRHLLPLLLALLGGCAEPDRPTVSFYRAIHIGDLDQIERHLYWGAEVNARDADGNMPLHVAAAAGRWVAVELLLDHGADIEARSRNGETPIEAALMAGRTQVADLLLERGARLDADALLHQVVQNRVEDRDVVRFLVQRGGDIDHPGEKGKTPLHEAVAGGYRGIAKLLVGQGADVNAVDGEGRTPLDLAVAKGDQDLAALLRSQGAVATAER